MNNYLLGIIIFFFVTLLLVAVVAIKVWKGKRGFTNAEKRFFKDQWANVFEQSQEQPNMAILDADKLLYKALDKRGYQGSVGEKLKAKPFTGEMLNNIWYAHKVRNRIAHETNFRMSSGEVKRVLKHFEQALRELGAL